MKKTALVVDDDAAIREYLFYILQKMGFETLEAENGNRALEILRARRIDLFITDLVMDEGEGIETIVEVRKNDPALPVIAISGAGKASMYLTMAKELGANEVFSKPLDRDAFEKTVKGLVFGE